MSKFVTLKIFDLLTVRFEQAKILIRLATTELVLAVKSAATNGVNIIASEKNLGAFTLVRITLTAPNASKVAQLYLLTSKGIVLLAKNIKATMTHKYFGKFGILILKLKNQR